MDVDTLSPNVQETPHQQWKYSSLRSGPAQGCRPMHESIRNDGGFKGGETIVHAQGRTTPQAPLQSAPSTPSDALIGRPVAFKSDKVVTRVVTDVNFSWGSKHTRVLGGDSIGEQNRCNYDLSQRNRSHPCPLPHTIALHSATKIFSQFFEVN